MCDTTQKIICNFGIIFNVDEWHNYVFYSCQNHGQKFTNHSRYISSIKILTQWSHLRSLTKYACSFHTLQEEKYILLTHTI